MDRFTEIISTQKIRDNVTGKEYYGLIDGALLDEINRIYKQNKELKKIVCWIVTDKEFDDDESEKKL